jgi:hypothetical protein
MGMPILCLDFDGVLHSYFSGWKGATIIPDPPVHGAIEFLYEAIFHFEVHIFSSRSCQQGGIDAMQDWLVRWEKEWIREQREIGRSTPRTSLLPNIQWPIDKPAAFLTIDDRAITFTGVWPTMQALQSFKPWNKRY